MMTRGWCVVSHGNLYVVSCCHWKSYVSELRSSSSILFLPATDEGWGDTDVFNNSERVLFGDALS